MAKIFEVNIVFRPRGKTVLINPAEIIVPRYSIVRWNVLYWEPHNWDFGAYQKGLIYSVYFRNGSPFSWETESLRAFGIQNSPPPFREKLTMQVAEGEAKKKGRFKYGVEVSEPDKDEPLYDEDPYIVVD
jgi:hypothetical protein